MSKCCHTPLRYFNKLISIIKKEPNNSYINSENSRIVICEVFAYIKTTDATEWFEGSNLQYNYTNIITVIYDNVKEFNIQTKTHSILYDGIEYDIRAIQNKDEENKELIMKCSKRGVYNES